MSSAGRLLPIAAMRPRFVFDNSFYKLGADSTGAMVGPRSGFAPFLDIALRFCPLDSVALGAIDPSTVLELFNEGIGASEIARRLKIGRASVYRVLDY